MGTAGITRPCGSVTWPAIWPLSDCEKARVTLKKRQNATLSVLTNVRDMNCWLLRFSTACLLILFSCAARPLANRIFGMSSLQTFENCIARYFGGKAYCCRKVLVLPLQDL